MENESVCWFIGTDPNPEDRVKIVVSASDARKQPEWGSVRPFTVTDRLTGNCVQLRRADCGLGCQCALEFVE